MDMTWQDKLHWKSFWSITSWHDTQNSQLLCVCLHLKCVYLYLRAQCRGSHCSNAKLKTCKSKRILIYLFIFYIYIFSFWFKRDRTYQLVGYSYFCRYLQNNLILERKLQVLEAWTSNFNYIPYIFSTKKKLYIYIYKGSYYRISTKGMFGSSF